MTRERTFLRRSNFNSALNLDYSGLPFSYDQISRLPKFEYSLVINTIKYIAQIDSRLLELKQKVFK